MADQLRNTDPLAPSVRDTRNKIKTQIGAGAAFHLDASEKTIGAANGDGTIATALVLANQIAKTFDGTIADRAYPGHRQDTLAHKAADTTALAAAYPATDLATAQTLANDIKAKMNTHIASTTFHYNADATNTIASANATNQASLDTLLNEIKTKLNAHMASAPTNCAASVRLIDA
jgi:hypothetical protein